MNKMLLSGISTMAILVGSSGVAQACTYIDGGCGENAGLTNQAIYDSGGDQQFYWDSSLNVSSITLTVDVSGVSSKNWDETWNIVVNEGDNFTSGTTLWSNIDNGTYTETWDSSDSFFNQLLASDWWGDSTNELNLWFTESTWGTDCITVTTKLDINCQAVPLPAGAPLFLGGMTLIGWAGMRRRRRSA